MWYFFNKFCYTQVIQNKSKYGYSLFHSLIIIHLYLFRHYNLINWQSHPSLILPVRQFIVSLCLYVFISLFVSSWLILYSSVTAFNIEVTLSIRWILHFAAEYIVIFV